MKTVRLVVCFAAALAVSLEVSGQDNFKNSGPTTLVITYRCPPAQRVELRKRVLQTGLARLQRLQEGGTLREYHVLFSRYVDSDSWDMLSLLVFPRYSDVANWRKVEWTAPAGLEPETLALTTAVNTYPVDLARQNTIETPPAQPVYLVIPYTYSVSPAEYLSYVDEYVKPQFDGWLAQGVLTKYLIYQQRYTAARPWDSLIFLQYNGDDGLGQRESTAEKLRQRLQSNPEWRARSENKKNIRTEKQAVIADELAINR
jgi:hypothetical protein